MGLNLNPVALIGLILYVLATLSSPVHPDAALTNGNGKTNRLRRGTASSAFDAHANINEARGSGSCAMLSSLSACSAEDTWCHGPDCWSQYWTVFKSTSDLSCHSLMGLDLNGRPGGPMFCVKNRVALNGAHTCSSHWNGKWIVNNKDNCDDSAQSFHIPVQETRGLMFILPWGAMSVRYDAGN